MKLPNRIGGCQEFALKTGTFLIMQVQHFGQDFSREIQLPNGVRAQKSAWKFSLSLEKLKLFPYFF